jgi:hypothetical protein
MSSIERKYIKLGVAFCVVNTQNFPACSLQTRQTINKEIEGA